MLAFDHHDSLSGENGGQRLTQRYTAGESKKVIDNMKDNPKIFFNYLSQR